jgi:hypothetical protein
VEVSEHSVHESDLRCLVRKDPRDTTFGEDRRSVRLHAGQDVLVAVDGEAGPRMAEPFRNRRPLADNEP